jgi:hypothetical protein
MNFSHLLNGNGGWAVEDVLKEKEYYEPSMPPGDIVIWSI